MIAFLFWDVILTKQVVSCNNFKYNCIRKELSDFVQSVAAMDLSYGLAGC